MEHLKCLSITVPVSRWMVLVLEERVACYAHTWHLAATALCLSLLPAEPSLTLPCPASSAGWSKRWAFHNKGQHISIIPWLFLAHCSYVHHLWNMFIFGAVYFFPLISSFDNEAMPCLHVQNIVLLHMNRPFICCLHPNTGKQIYESISCLVLMNSPPAEHSFYAFSCLA